MNAVSLCIGSKNLSSWSLRPWLLLKHHGVPFKEVLIALDRPDTHERVLKHSPSGRVPVLLHGRTRVWESLAICEYAAETFALPAAWPTDPEARAFARAIAHEMHAGFADLRRELPFDATRDPAGKTVSAAAQADIERVRAIWREARSRYGWQGEWLFGHFGIADAMFAPVALRFHSYAVALEGVEADYVRSVLAHPAVQQWIEAAAVEVPSVPAPKPAPVEEASAEPQPAPAPAVAMAVAPQPVEKQVVENQAAEKQVEEKRAAEKPPAEKQPEAPRRLRSFILPAD